MDVHGTKLARTLFTVATEQDAVPPNVNPCTRHAKRMRVKGGVSYEGSVMNVSNDGQPYAPIHVVNQLGSE